MQYIITSSIEKLYTFVVTELVLENLEKIIDSYLESCMDQKFHSLQVLKENQGFAVQMIKKNDFL